MGRKKFSDLPCKYFEYGIKIRHALQTNYMTAVLLLSQHATLPNFHLLKNFPPCRMSSFEVLVE